MATQTGIQERFVNTSEIILTVIQNYVEDLETLLAIRHTCRAWLKTTTAYEKSISHNIVQSQFRRQKRLLEATSVYNQPYTIPWLIQLVPGQLASILVDRHRTIRDEHMFGVPAEDPRGDALRSRVANGFRILRKLSLISQHVHHKQYPTAHAVHQEEELQRRTSTSSKTSRRLSRTNSGFRKMFTSPDVSLAKRREQITFERRKEYLLNLAQRDREDYQIMSIFLVGCFEHLWEAPTTINGTALDGPLDFGMPPRHWIGRKDSFANWYILHYGPSIFWDQWWACKTTSEPSPLSLFRKMELDFSKRSRGVLNVEREYAFKIEKEMQRGLDHARYNPPPELMEYQTLWQQLSGDKRNSLLPFDSLGCVSFRVDETPAPGGLHVDCARHVHPAYRRSDSPIGEVGESGSDCAVMKWFLSEFKKKIATCE